MTRIRRALAAFSCGAVLLANAGGADAAISDSWSGFYKILAMHFVGNDVAFRLNNGTAPQNCAGWFKIAGGADNYTAKVSAIITSYTTKDEININYASSDTNCYKSATEIIVNPRALSD